MSTSSGDQETPAVHDLEVGVHADGTADVDSRRPFSPPSRRCGSRRRRPGNGRFLFITAHDVTLRLVFIDDQDCVVGEVHDASRIRGQIHHIQTRTRTGVWVRTGVRTGVRAGVWDELTGGVKSEVTAGVGPCWSILVAGVQADGVWRGTLVARLAPGPGSALGFGPRLGARSGLGTLSGLGRG